MVSMPVCDALRQDQADIDEGAESPIAKSSVILDIVELVVVPKPNMVSMRITVTICVPFVV